MILQEFCEVTEANWDKEEWQVRCNDGSVLSVQRIWLATGTKFDATQNPLISDIFAASPPKIINGLPVLDEHLRIPGWEVGVAQRRDDL